LDGPYESGRRLVLFTVTALYTLAIFVSATLLFLVQPLFARMLLPMLGGSPSVWNTALLFYQGVLLLGYGYAHLTTRYLPVKRQIAVHLVLLALPLVVLPIQVRLGAPAGDANPIGWILVAMSVSVGLPFLVVSTTSPLLQRWYGAMGSVRSTDPYFMYAASNIGSLLALILYPTVLEPWLRLMDQSWLWAGGYLIYGGLVVACALALRRVPDVTTSGALADLEAPAQGRLARPTWLRRAKWVLFAFIPSSLMLSVTTYMTTDIAVFPLLWIIPLTLYLVSFIIVFSRRPILPHKVMVAILPVLLLCMLLALGLPIKRPLDWMFGFHLLTFFVAAMVFHGELAEDRPSVAHLTEFYFLMSLGGVLGGFFNAIVAPTVFSTVWEYPVTLVAACFLLPTARVFAARLVRKPPQPESEEEAPPVVDRRARRNVVFNLILDAAAPLAVLFFTYALFRRAELEDGFTWGWRIWPLIYGAPILLCLVFFRRPVRFGLAAVALFGFALWQQTATERIVHEERGFFGVLRVRTDSASIPTFSLMHGTTVHGIQSSDPMLAREPVSYYAKNGPVGQVMQSMDLEGATIAVVGLGVGTMAAYSRPGQRWTLYEIDPAVERIARNPAWFTYLRDAAGSVTVKLGDARIQLDRSADKYKLIILDAYSSDAVPIHLITREAMQVYLDHLAPGGLLAYHISNRHLDLEPVLANLATSLDCVAYTRDHDTTFEDRALGKQSSQWVVVARDKHDLQPLIAKGDWFPSKTRSDVGLWTDDYSSVLKVIKSL